MKKLLNIVFILPLLMMGSLVNGQDLVLAQRIVEHHLSASENANIAEVMSDYAENAVLISDGIVIKGKAAIRQTFEQLLTGADPLPLKVTRSAYEENIGFIVWTMENGLEGSDTFIIENKNMQVYLPYSIKI
ncbi:MAG: nuclear transport factor 2 family protein, partial [Gammaproteobacteria bacterium]|nr:nuclear transport factor 2 family protein [Gammaproteobacteria bacterium]